MTALVWTDTLALHQPLMDDTHREFIALLGEVETAAQHADPVAAVSASLTRFVAHTEAHFGQEDAWMATIGFAATNCHATQHAQVLQLLREVQRRVQDDGNLALVGQLVPALAEWFVPHAQNMDGGLAQVMAATGFDPATGAMTNPPDAQSAPALTSDAAFNARAATTASAPTAA